MNRLATALFYSTVFAVVVTCLVLIWLMIPRIAGACI